MAEKKKNRGRKKSGKGVKKEKVCEVFEIKKDGEETLKESCGVQEIEEVKKEQIKKENNILRNILIIAGVIIAVFLITYFFVQSSKTFEYEGREFNIIDEGNVRFYHTSFPWVIKEKDVIYNIYLRKDPRQNYKNVPFDGNLVVGKAIVMNMTEDFNCEGKGVIAIANFNQIFTALEVTIMADKNASCDEQGRYTFINIEEGEETKIIKYGPSCYKFVVNNCEILDVTERFITETLSAIETE